MILPVRFAELCQPLFLKGKDSGRNLGMKLENKSGVKLEYDDEKDWLIVSCDGVTSILRATVHCIQFESESDLKIVPPPPEPPKPFKKIKAQVSSPTEHVFQGEGHGIYRNS